MATLGKAVIELSAETAQFTSDIGRASAQFERALGRMEHGLSGLKDAALTLVGFGGIGDVFKEIIARTTDAERSFNLLNAVLRSTGYAAGQSAGDIEELSRSLSKSSVFDDDEIRKGITSLLRFQDVQGNVFKQAAQLGTDLAAALGTSLPDAFQKVGRALSDPERGMRALREAGVFLSESQTELAKKLQKTGDVAGYQKIVLEELQKTVGGSASGENAGLFGATKAVEKAWDSFLKTLGGMEHVGSRVNRILNGTREALEYITKQLPQAEKATGGSLAQYDAAIGAAGRESDRMIAALQADVDKRVDDILKKSNEEYLKREERLRDEDIKGWVAHAEAVFQQADEENLALAKISDEYWEREEKLRQQDVQGWVAHAEAVFQAADEENLALAKIADDGARKAQEAARELGLTFESVFEDAIVEGKKLSDVLKAIEQDIARIIIRKAITEPLAGAVSGAIGGIDFGGIFGGLFGGSTPLPQDFTSDFPAFASGTDYVPRTGLALVHEGERIIPAAQNRGGGDTYNIAIHATDAQSFASMMASPVGRAVIVGTVRKAANSRGRSAGV